MDTPSSPAPVIDFRVRPPYRSFLDAFHAGGGVAPPGASVLIQRVFDEVVPSRAARSFELFLGELADANVVKAGLMGRMGGPRPVLNDDIALLVGLHPDRFFGIGGLDTTDVSQALAEIDRCHELGLVGVTFDSPSGRSPRRHDDPAFDVLFARCAALGMLACLNCSANLAADLSYVEPVAVQRVALAHPQLKVLVAHASWPWVQQICAVAFQTPNVYLLPDLTRDLPGEEAFEQAAAAGLGPQILCASSYPGTGVPAAADAYRRRILGERPGAAAAAMAVSLALVAPAGHTGEGR